MRNRDVKVKAMAALFLGVDILACVFLLIVAAQGYGNLPLAITAIILAVAAVLSYEIFAGLGELFDDVEFIRKALQKELEKESGAGERKPTETIKENLVAGENER